MLFVFHPKILYKHCFQFLSGVKITPRETEDKAYAKFWGDKQKAFLYVMVFLEWSIQTRPCMPKYCFVITPRQSWTRTNQISKHWKNLD